MSGLQLDKEFLNDGSLQNGSTDYAYTLEIKVPDPNNATKTITKKVRLLIDWTEITNKPSNLGSTEFKSRFDFPNIGNSNTLYVALNENKIYRFDVNHSSYVVVGSDWNDIDLIDCGGATWQL